MVAPARPPPTESHYVPPITIPIPKLSTNANNKQTKKKPGRPPAIGEPKPRASRRKAVVDSQDNNAGNFQVPSPTRPSPPGNLSYTNNANNSTSLTSPSIKLRIFKDKTTSTFVSTTTDAVPPPKLKSEHEASDKKKKEKKKPGRAKKHKEELPPPQPEVKRAPGRITRSSRRQISNTSDTPMPTLRRVSENSLMDNNSVDLVKKLEEEDDEFRQMSAMLSSMEGDTEPSTSAISQPSHEQPTNSNYFTSTEEMKPASPASPKDIRALLEDDWDDDEDSPRKGSQTPKHCNVTRFDMTAFMPEQTKAIPIAIAPVVPSPEVVNNVAHTSASEATSSQVFNAPYAVRNLLADFTEAKPDLKTEETQESTTPTEAEQVESVAPKVNTRSAAKKDVKVNNQVKQPSISTKKVSIFKSRAAAATASDSQGESTSPKKRLALYTHKFGQETGEKNENTEDKNKIVSNTVEFDENDAEVDSRGIRIKNVKATHELQESGEAMEFDGDILYILDDLKDKNPISSRCLSAITLAMRCMEPAFRMHLRAHGTVGEFCRELQDAPNNPVSRLFRKADNSVTMFYNITALVVLGAGIAICHSIICVKSRSAQYGPRYRQLASSFSSYKN